MCVGVVEAASSSLVTQIKKAGRPSGVLLFCLSDELRRICARRTEMTAENTRFAPCRRKRVREAHKSRLFNVLSLRSKTGMCPTLRTAPFLVFEHMFDHICHEKAICHKAFQHFAIFILCKMTAVLCFENRRLSFSVGFFFDYCGAISPP